MTHRHSPQTPLPFDWSCHTHIQRNAPSRSGHQHQSTSQVLCDSGHCRRSLTVLLNLTAKNYFVTTITKMIHGGSPLITARKRDVLRHGAGARVGNGVVMADFLWRCSPAGAFLMAGRVWRCWFSGEDSVAMMLRLQRGFGGDETLTLRFWWR